MVAMPRTTKNGKYPDEQPASIHHAKDLLDRSAHHVGFVKDEYFCARTEPSDGSHIQLDLFFEFVLKHLLPAVRFAGALSFISAMVEKNRTEPAPPYPSSAVQQRFFLLCKNTSNCRLF
jgi:hypothetical protein